MNIQKKLPLFHGEHGRTNFESGAISLFEWEWSIEKIAETMGSTREEIINVLETFGYIKAE